MITGMISVCGGGGGGGGGGTLHPKMTTENHRGPAVCTYFKQIL